MDKNKIKANVPVPDQRRSTLTDPRPFRVSSFIKDAKCKLVKFFEYTGFSDKLDTKLWKLSQNDVKNIFTHLISLLCSDFEINNSKMILEDRIVNFFTSVQYNNNLTKTHLTSPSILSSRPYIFAAFDYLRRIVIAHTNIYPAMFFPPMNKLNMSTECVFNALVTVFHEVEKNIPNNNSDVLELFTENLRREIYLDSNSEIDAISKNIHEIEELISKIQVTKTDIEDIQTQTDDLTRTIELKHSDHEAIKKLNEDVLVNITRENVELELILNEKSKLLSRKEKYEEMGYGPQMKSMEFKLQSLDKVRGRNREMKQWIDTYQQQNVDMQMEIDDLKFLAQKEFADVRKTFPDLIVDKLQLFVNDMNINYVLNYDSTYRSLLSELVQGIEHEINVLQSSFEMNEKATVDLRIEKENLENLLEDAELEERQLVKHVKKYESNLSDINEDIFNQNKLIQDLMNQINEDVLEIEKLEQDLTADKKKYDYSKIVHEEAKQFYDVDLEFMKGCAEIHLETLQDSWEVHQSIEKETETILREKEELINIQRMKMEKIAREINLIEEKLNIFNEIS